MSTPHVRTITPTLDLVTPAPAKSPGVLIACMNHEPIAAGLGRVGGFERIDGQTKPSDASYSVLDFDAGTATITEGQVVAGATSLATGKALTAMVVESGSFGGSNAAGYLVLTAVSGTFQDNEALQVAAVTKCTANGLAIVEGADNDTDHNTWIQDAAETARALITAIPGSGSTLGGFLIGNTRYGIRNNAGGTAAEIYRATTSGWSLIALGRRIAFTSGGTYETVAGNTITGAISGATAVVTRVTVTAGAFSTGDAEGWLVFASDTGVFQAENLNVGANLNVATIAGDAAAITLPASGHYEFASQRFSEIGALYRIYMVNGVGPAIEFDGTVTVPIVSPETTDTPNHIAAHHNHLILSFPNGRLYNSAIGDPYNYTDALGSKVHNLGHACTGLVGPYAKGLVVYSTDETQVLFGTDASEFMLDSVNAKSGAHDWSAQLVDVPIAMDDGGIRKLTATANYGDFNVGTLTQLVQPYIDGKKAQAVTVVGSIVCKRKTQYRVFFSDGTGLTIFLGRKKPEVLPFDLGKVCTFAQAFEDASGNEVLLFGSTDGFLYELDSGPNFDGAEVEAYWRPAFDYCGPAMRNKRFHSMTLIGNFPSNTTVYHATEYDYSDPLTPASTERNITVAGQGGIWSQDDNWNEFQWSGATVTQKTLALYGKGENASTAFTTECTYEEPYVISAYIYQTSPWGSVRAVHG